MTTAIVTPHQQFYHIVRLFNDNICTWLEHWWSRLRRHLIQFYAILQYCNIIITRALTRQFVCPVIDTPCSFLVHFTDGIKYCGHELTITVPINRGKYIDTWSSQRCCRALEGNNKSDHCRLLLCCSIPAQHTGDQSFIIQLHKLIPMTGCHDYHYHCCY